MAILQKKTCQIRPWLGVLGGSDSLRKTKIRNIQGCMVIFLSHDRQSFEESSRVVLPCELSLKRNTDRRDLLGDFGGKETVLKGAKSTFFHRGAL